MNLGKRRQEGLDALLGKTMGHGPFVPRAGMYRKPFFAIWLDEYSWIWRLRCLNADVQKLTPLQLLAASSDLNQVFAVL
jgi:hypothetical protein